MKRLLAISGALFLLMAAIFALWLARATPDERMQACARVGLCRQPINFVDAALVAVQRQQQLVVLAARLITVVSATDQRTVLGVPVASATKTMVVPGTARYALDLKAMQPEDLSWNAESSTLHVRRPRLLILGPEVDLARAQEFSEGKLLLALTNGGTNLDRINRRQVGQKLLAEAQRPDMVKLARTAGDEALIRTFALPLLAAGIADAKIVIGD